MAEIGMISYDHSLQGTKLTGKGHSSPNGRKFMASQAANLEGFNPWFGVQYGTVLSMILSQVNFLRS